jgi:hypothetical protein
VLLFEGPTVKDNHCWDRKGCFNLANIFWGKVIFNKAQDV